MTQWLTAFDELYYFMRIFRDQDTTLSLTGAKADDYYGFGNVANPIFTEYRILRFNPDVNFQMPSIQIVFDDESQMPGTDEGTLGDDTMSSISIYLIATKRQTLIYNDETYRIENINTVRPHDNDLLMLMRAFVFQRINDYRSYADSYITWDILDWTRTELIVGIGGVEDMVALKLTFDIRFQKVA